MTDEFKNVHSLKRARTINRIENSFYNQTEDL